MRPLKALLLSDGRPGHYHLSEGVLAAIARRRPVATTRVDVRRRPWMVGRFLAALVNAGASPGLVLRLGYGVSAARLPEDADLVVSAGGDTLAANIATARMLGVANIASNIFYGSLRRFRPEDFALVLTSHARNARRPRHVMTLKPSAADPDALPKLNGHAATDPRAPAVAGLLVGGNTTTIRFEREDWQRLEAFLCDLWRTHGTRWIVSNSRRTPKAATESLARLAAEPGGPILDFIDVAHAGSGTLGELFARSAAVLCTVDSSSMLSEAVWMRRPVIAVKPGTSRLSEQEQEYRDYLAANGWARELAIADLTAERVLALLDEMTPLRANPLDRLASTLAERLPELFHTTSLSPRGEGGSP